MSATTIACRFKTAKAANSRKPVARRISSRRASRSGNIQTGTHAVFHGQRCLGRYNQKGAFTQEKMAT